jgi:hypothetical protein
VLLQFPREAEARKSRRRSLVAFSTRAVAACGVACEGTARADRPQILPEVPRWRFTPLLWQGSGNAPAQLSRCPARTRESQTRPTETWTVDFLHDQPATGRKKCDRDSTKVEDWPVSTDATRSKAASGICVCQCGKVTCLIPPSAKYPQSGMAPEAYFGMDALSASERFHAFVALSSSQPRNSMRKTLAQNILFSLRGTQSGRESWEEPIKRSLIS